MTKRKKKIAAKKPAKKAKAKKPTLSDEFQRLRNLISDLGEMFNDIDIRLEKIENLLNLRKASLQPPTAEEIEENDFD